MCGAPATLAHFALRLPAGDGDPGTQHLPALPGRHPPQIGENPDRQTEAFKVGVCHTGRGTHSGLGSARVSRKSLKAPRTANVSFAIIRGYTSRKRIKVPRTPVLQTSRLQLS